METNRHVLSPPTLEELADVLLPALQTNYATASAIVTACPDLRNPPFNFAFEGLSGCETIADIGGQANLFPRPLEHKKYSLIDCAKCMNMSSEQGCLLGAGAGPFQTLGKNFELAPILSWKKNFGNLQNLTRGASVICSSDGVNKVECAPTNSTDCAMMMNMYGCLGAPGPILKVTARGRRGDHHCFTDFMRHAIRNAYGDERQVSMGGVFIIKTGRARFHVMPDFPPAEQMPFKDTDALDQWLTYHEFGGPMVCLGVFHSADPQELGIRMEHTHCFSPENNEGGHYHYDVSQHDDQDEIEYEGYFNTAKTYYQIDKPSSA